MPFWAVATTKSNSERRAQFHLHRQGFETYLPRFREKIIINSLVRDRTKLLFPRYIFIHIVDVWYSVLSTFGIISVLRDGELPAVVPDRVISELRAREDRRGFVRLPDRGLSIGQKVRIKEGPFAGQMALYKGQSSGQRESILLASIGIRVELTTGNLVAA